MTPAEYALARLAQVAQMREGARRLREQADAIDADADTLRDRVWDECRAEMGAER